ncbi:MAG TPA: cupin domain-containing protein [Candidatus Acidoferrales bacterium]|nr:cupin domain-containing protein [Candidatus Acidoferrales bacterium]
MFAISQSELPFVGMSYEFVGKEHGGVAVSFFLVVAKPGQSTPLHKHDYDEIVYVIEGQSAWMVGDQERQAKAGDVLVVRAGEPHKFVNAGHGELRQIDIHLNSTFETIWLES